MGNRFNLKTRKISALLASFMMFFVFVVSSPVVTSAASALTNTSTISATSVTKGTAITITGSASGGAGTYYYKMYAKHSTASGYTLLRDYSTTKTKTWTPAKTGTYTVLIRVKDTGGNLVDKTYTLTVSSALTNTSTISATSVTKGTAITITGSASGGAGTYYYKMYAKYSTASGYTLLRDYSTTKTKTWTPAKTGTYTVLIRVKDTGGNLVDKTYTLTVSSALTNTSTISATSVTKGTAITITGSASGGTGTYYYKMYAKHSTASGYTLLRDYSTTKTKTWTPSSTGTYTILVRVKDEGGSLIDKTFTLTVNSVLVNNTTVGDTTVEQGSYFNIYFAASGGSGSYEYKVLVSKKETVIISGTYSSVSRLIINTTGMAGNYDVSVTVTDSDGNTAEKTFTLTVTYDEVDTEAYAAAVIELINEERAANGLSELSTNETLSAIAMARAEEISEYYSHTRPNGTSCFTIAAEYGLTYAWAGENIAYGYSSPEAVMEAWMNSEGHKANILSSNYDYVGVGCYEEDGVLYWVQFFVGT